MVARPISRLSECGVGQWTTIALANDDIDSKKTMREKKKHVNMFFFFHFGYVVKRQSPHSKLSRMCDGDFSSMCCFAFLVSVFLSNQCQKINSTVCALLDIFNFIWLVYAIFRSEQT